MEKIYEENNQNQKPRKINFSILLSFAVALFAVVSLIAVGFNQISYAAPVDGASNITLRKAKMGSQLAFVNARGLTNEIVAVPLFYADSEDAATATQPLFCVEHGVDASAGTYNPSTETMKDTGLIYLLNRSASLGGTGIIPKSQKSSLKYPVEGGTEISDTDYKYLEYYATQVAIWIYLHDTVTDATDPRHGKLDNPLASGTTPYSILTGQVILELPRTDNNQIYAGNLYTQYIRSAVESAKTATNAKTIRAQMDSETISKVGDDDTYQTDKIRAQANPSSDLVNYSVDLSGIDGAYVVDKDGNTKTALDTFAPDDFFYVRVPINKVTDEAQTVTIKLVGEFQNYFDGEYYVSTGSQTVVAVTSEHYRVENETRINFLKAPDTGMTTAQTIYFIGLIVLLCGVGIIYANAKPVEEK